MFKSENTKSQSGNAAVIVLVAVVVVAVGGLGYFAGTQKSGMGAQEKSRPVQQQAAQQQAAQENAEPAEQIVIEPGNPVVAKVGEREITRLDVFKFIQTLPANARQLPVQQLFPAALEQVVVAALTNQKTQGVNLDSDPEVQRQLEAAKKNIVRTVYVQNQINNRITDERLRQVYEQYKAAFPDINEVRARHVLVEDKETAEEVIKQLEQGADFAELAKEKSKDRTAENGGDVGYFSEQDVVPEFAAASFALEAGEYSKEPVKSEFGYHVIEVTEKRKRPVPEFEQAKPFLEGQIRGVVMEEMLRDWRDSVDIERYDINGKPIEPAAGDEEAQQ